MSRCNSKLLVSFLLVACLKCCFAADNQYNISLAGQTCYAQPIDYGYLTYSYTISVDQGYQLPAGCDPTQILVSDLYITGSCLQAHDNSVAECPVDFGTGTIVPLPLSQNAETAPVSNITAFCNQVFAAQGAVSINNPTIVSDSVRCAPSGQATIFIQNNCPADAGASNFTVSVTTTGSDHYVVADSTNKKGTSSSSSSGGSKPSSSGGSKPSGSSSKPSSYSPSSSSYSPSSYRPSTRFPSYTYPSYVNRFPYRRTPGGVFFFLYPWGYGGNGGDTCVNDITTISAGSANTVAIFSYVVAALASLLALI